MRETLLEAAVLQTVSAINNIEIRTLERREARRNSAQQCAAIGNAAEVNAAKNAAVVDRVSWRCPAFIEAENASGIGFLHTAANGETRALYWHF